MKSDQEIQEELKKRRADMIKELGEEVDRLKDESPNLSFEAIAVTFLIGRITELQVSIDLLRELIMKKK